MKNILVPVDFSDMTAPSVESAAEQALAFGATVRLLHVVPADPAFASQKSWPQEVRDVMALELKKEHRFIQEIADSLKERGVKAKAQLTRGGVTDSILEFADKTKADLIVLGAHPKGAFAQLLPHSVVKDVLKKATCPVMIVPHPREPASEAQR